MRFWWRSRRYHTAFLANAASPLRQRHICFQVASPQNVAANVPLVKGVPYYIGVITSYDAIRASAWVPINGNLVKVATFILTGLCCGAFEYCLWHV